MGDSKAKNVWDTKYCIEHAPRTKNWFILFLI